MIWPKKQYPTKASNLIANELINL